MTDTATRAVDDFGPTVYQLVFTFVFGSMLYAVRRATGTLIIPMILHGTWDFASFTASSDAFKKSEELVDPRTNPAPFLLLVVMHKVRPIDADVGLRR